jgi:hypothetical protein
MVYWRVSLELTATLNCTFLLIKLLTIGHEVNLNKYYKTDNVLKRNLGVRSLIFFSSSAIPTARRRFA